jgi:ABC-type multidrug transport system ATPase subunit
MNKMYQEEKILSIKNFSVRLGDKLLLRNISLKAVQGRVVALIGPNGAGKTTLFRTLCGLQRKQEGSLEYKGKSYEPDAPDWHKLISFVPDHNDLFQELTVKEHFSLLRELLELDKASAEERTGILLELFDLTGQQHKLERELSFGLRKRLAISLSLLPAAEIFLFDEPFNGLDVASMDVFCKIIAFLRAEQRLVIISTHFVSLLLELCDEVWEMVAGEVINTVTNSRTVKNGRAGHKQGVTRAQSPGGAQITTDLSALLTVPAQNMQKMVLPWLTSTR